MNRFSIPLIYALVSSAWIAGSDSLLAALNVPAVIHSVKGVVFVVVTSLLLHRLVQRYGARLQERERMQVLGEVTARVSHELRNVLMAARTLSSVLQRCVEKSPKAASASRHLESAFDRGEVLLSEILGYAASRPAKRERVIIAEWLRNFVDCAKHTVRNEVAIDAAAPGDLIGEVDPTQLHQLLSNLVLNANDAIDGRGRITIQASAAAVDTPGFVLTVRDDGPGMPPEVARRIFEPLFTTKSKGTGLGLAIVRRIAAAHGGSVILESAVGAGTAFHAFFPARQSV
jgi:signal transduction histidine kinase